MDPKLKKYEELYALSKEAVAEGIERIRKTDEKAHKFSTLSGLLMVVSAVGGKSVIESVVPPGTLFAWVSLISYLLFFAVILFAFVNILRSMRVSTLGTSGVNKEVMDFFDKEEDYLDILYALTRRNNDIVESNDALCRDKLKCLLKTYNALLLSVGLISVLVVSFILSNIHKC
jgi:hypothetical protein